MDYYNEFDAFPAQWLRNLIEAGEIPQGLVDERSIKDVDAAELVRFRQCHFFCGISGWVRAFQIAGIQGPGVWTGSCPCQPFSDAGEGLGTADPRHLWPDFCRLIAQSGPAIVFGEQVASKAGREWVSGVRADLEALGYAVGIADLCAAGVGAPHIRQRIYWGGARDGSPYRLCDSIGERLEGHSRHGDDSRKTRQQRKQESRPPLPQKSIDMMESAIAGKDADKLKQMLDPANKSWREMFESSTGQKLPKTIKETYKAVDAWAASKEFSRADKGCRANLIAAIHSCLNHDGKHKPDESVDTQIPEDPAQLDPHVAQVLQALAGQDPDVKEALGEYLASCAG